MMRIDIRDWEINREVTLFEEFDDGVTLGGGSFFTTATEAEIRDAAGLIPNDPHEARRGFKALEAKLPPPKIGGSLAHFHPYWEDHGWKVEK
jgi:hypothetical protein